MKYQIGQRLWYVPNWISAYNQPREVTVDAVGSKWVKCDAFRFDRESGSVDGGRDSSRGRVYASREEYERIVAIQAAWSNFVKSLSVWSVPPGLTVEKIETVKSILFEEECKNSDFD